MYKFYIYFLFLFSVTYIYAQDIPQHISYTRIYDFLDELATDKIIELNTTIKPYPRNIIAEKLVEAQSKSFLLTKRQQKDLTFFLNDYAIERDTLPTSWVHVGNKKTWDLALAQPAFHYRDNYFKCRVTPLLGMDLMYNKNGLIIKRWFGADFQATIVNHISIYANYRDNSFNGNHLKKGLSPMYDARISQPQYLNNLPGAEYKEANYGGDFSDMRGGIKFYCKWGSIGLIKDNIIWGDSYNSSNIFSGRAPSFPMITLHVKPVRWFELNYIHGWLISNEIDSTRYYVENDTESSTKRHYRPANKFIAANMLTFTPIPHLNISVGNSIVYAESNIQPAYLIPIAFYKSIDHLLSKGVKVENQNSQIFFNISSRNIKHLHLYGSLFIDELNFKRFKKDNPEHNIFSYKVGFEVSNFPLNNLSLVGEFTRTSPLNYKHSIQTLTWASNSYNLGHYLGANSQEIFVSLQYKPIKSLNLKLSYVNALHGNEYEYIRKEVRNIIKENTLKEITWQNNMVRFEAIYEVFNNAYAVLSVEYNNAAGYNLSSEKIGGEVRMDAQGYLDEYTPKFFQGKNNITLTAGFSFGF